MGALVARKERGGAELSPAAPVQGAHPASATPLDPLIAVLSRAAERSSPAPAADPPSKAPG